MCPYCGERDCAHVVLRFRGLSAVARLYMWSELGVNTVHASPRAQLADEIVNALKTFCSVQRGVIYATEWGREYARRQVTTYLREAGSEVDSGDV